MSQCQSGGAGTWNQDRPHSCAELSEKHILQSTYSTGVCGGNKTGSLKENHNIIFRSIQDQEKLTALTTEEPEDKVFGKGLFIKLTEVLLPC